MIVCDGDKGRCLEPALVKITIHQDAFAADRIFDACGLHYQIIREMFDRE